PLGEFDFCHENWIHPMHLLHHRWRNSLDPLAALFRGQIRKWTIVAFFLLKFPVHNRQRLCRKSRPDLAGKHQPALFVMTDQNRAEMFARAAWGRESPDTKFLFFSPFELHPWAAPRPGFI